MLNSFDIDNINIEVILYQAGYLTIEKMITTRRGKIEYKLKLPNKEVQQSLNDVILDFLTNQRVEKSRHQDAIYDAIVDMQLDDLESSLKNMFASIPYNNYVSNNIAHFEGYYASVIYTYFQSLGFEIIAEDVTNKGRIDLTIKLIDAIYVIEFKVDGKNAMQQIKDKKYYEKYIDNKKAIYLVGINFNEEDRNISGFERERV